MNFPYHTESVSQHVDQFKPINFFWKNVGKTLIISLLNFVVCSVQKQYKSKERLGQTKIWVKKILFEPKFWVQQTLSPKYLVPKKLEFQKIFGPKNFGS